MWQLLLLPLLAAMMHAPAGRAQLEYAGGWGERYGFPGVNGSWVNLQFEVGESAAVAAAQQSIPSLATFRWTAPDTSRMINTTTGTCASTIKRFGNTTKCLTLRSDYKEAWARLWATIKPLVQNDTYVGVFLGDESMWGGASLANLTTVTDMIKRDWPLGITYINEAQDAANCNFNRLGDTIIGPDECLPDTLDWYGYDYYCTIPGCTQAYGVNSGWQVARDGMTNMIYPKLPRKEQRVVPTTLGFLYATNPMNSSMLARMDAYCVYTARQYAEWAAEDSRLVALFPFFYNPTGYGGNMIGLSNLTQCRAEYVKMGRAVVEARRRAGGRVSVGGGVPGRKRRCPRTEEKVKHPWCRKDREDL
jgi:hypothetical protein